ncbi:hypothetical protein [Algoriphagus namhaensis]
MKKALMIASMLVAGAATAAPLSSITVKPAIEIAAQQEREKIDPETLPDAVKSTISQKEETANLMIAEAWKITLPENQVQFEVHFDTGAEEKLTKKYDEQGNEIDL